MVTVVRTPKIPVRTPFVCASPTRFSNFLCSGVTISSPRDPNGVFPGLKAGDRWCVCLWRWIEALEAGVAPPVVLEATDQSVLDTVPYDLLVAHAWQG